MARINSIFLAALITALSLASFTMALTPAVYAKTSTSQFNGPPVSGFVASGADFSSETPGVGQITMTSCTDGTDLGGGNIRANCDSVKLPHNEMSVAVDPTNPDHIVAGSNDYEIFFVGHSSIERIIAGFYTSTDGGTTWVNGHIDPGGFTFNGDPAIAFNVKLGLVEYATIASNGGQRAGFATATIQVNTSPDGGQTFGHPVIVALGMGGTRVTVFNDKPYIAVDNNAASPFYGRTYVTWTRFTFDQFGRYISSPIFLAFSDDGGHTFSAGQEISGTSFTLCANALRSFNTNICNEDQFSSPVVGPDGTVYVAFENQEFQGASTGFRNQYLVVSSTNGGASFGSPSQAVFPIFDGGNDYPINVNGRQTLSNSEFRVNSAGNLAVDPSSGSSGPSNTILYVSYSDNAKGVTLCAPSCNPTTITTNTDVYIVSSTNGGTSWNTPVPLPLGGTSDNDQFYPWAAVTSTGGVLKVAFKDRSYDTLNIKYGETLATSIDGGVSFTSARATTPGSTSLSNPNDSRWFTNGGTTNGKATFIGDYEGLAIGSNGVSHPIWTDMRTSQFPSPPPGRGHNTQDVVTASI